jgi:uncharacterized protein
MLVSFSVANFRSFSTEQLFSLAASKHLGEQHAAHVMPLGATGEGVLRTGVIYGANASGRSSLHKALGFVKDVALLPRQGATGRTPFRLGDMGALPSTFDLQFLAGGKLYRYGFSLDDERIVEEWLAQTVGSQERPVYQRHTHSDGRVEISAPGLKNGSPQLAALVEAGVPAAQSFLAGACTQLTAPELGEALAEVIEWLAIGLTLLTPDSTPGMLGQSLASDADFRTFAGSFLRSCATGIDSIEVQKQALSPQEVNALLPRSLISHLVGQSGPYRASIPMPDDTELLAERTATGLFFHRLVIKTTHRHPGGGETVLELSEESDDTRRLLALVPALYQCSLAPAVFCIDEIDRGLHPMLVQKVIEYFLATSGGHPCQIIATTHDTHLLTRELLRRDEIWFVEKDSRGASHLYSLMDFKIDPCLPRSGYLQGRFGAVPFLGDIDHLIETQVETVD